MVTYRAVIDVYINFKRNSQMKKNITCFGIIISLILFAYIVINCTKPSLFFQFENDGSISLKYVTSTQTETIYPWFDEELGIHRFFLPSFAQDIPIVFQSEQADSVFINGSSIHTNYSLNWLENETYHIASSYTNNIVAITSSDNIPSMFITTSQEDINLLNESKDAFDSGSICTYTENGTLQYQGELEKISGRGNSTWNKPKKPYTIKLAEDAPLCGLESGKKYVLHAMYYEASNLSTKLALDLARYMELPFTSQSTWTDLYINGDYMGLYLLIEAVSIGEGRVEIYDLEKENKQLNGNLDTYPTFIAEDARGYLLDNTSTLSGGYLFEKVFSGSYKKGSVGFATNAGHAFNIRSPKHASKEQVYYIKDYVQNIENLIYSSDNSYANYIDTTSFAQRYLLEEFFNNYDAYYASTYFYKDRNSGKIYCSPPWDFDSAAGRNTTTTDYTASILTPHSLEYLDWWNYLYEDEFFYNQIVDNYASLLPVLVEYRDSKIDLYTAHIRKASEMDLLRWNYDKQYYYSSFENNVKYLKYYWDNRINALCERWNLPLPAPYAYDTPETDHTVSFVCIMPDGSESVHTIKVPDGSCIKDIPPLPENYLPWFVGKTYVSLTDKIPIYEDLTVYSYSV